jgi:hypothetical protein
MNVIVHSTNLTRRRQLGRTQEKVIAARSGEEYSGRSVRFIGLGIGLVGMFFRPIEKLGPCLVCSLDESAYFSDIPLR